MSLGIEYFLVQESAKGGVTAFTRVRLRTFQIPPVQDVAVIGRLAPIGPMIMKKALRLVSSESFAAINVQDDIIASILVRQAIVRKIGSEIVKKIVLQRVKPLMAKTEILALSLEIEVTLGEGL